MKGEAAALRAAITKLTRTPDLIVVAEGVEHEAQLDELRTLGCDRAQGHHFGGPLPPERIVDLLRQTDPARSR